MITSPATLKQCELIMRLSVYTGKKMTYEEASKLTIKEADLKIKYLMDLRNTKLKELESRKGGDTT